MNGSSYGKMMLQLLGLGNNEKLADGVIDYFLM